MNLGIVKGKITDLGNIKEDKNGRNYFIGELWTNSISFDDRQENVKVKFFVWEKKYVNMPNYKEHFLENEVYLIGYLKHIRAGVLYIIDLIVSLKELKDKNEVQEISNLIWKVIG